MSSASKTVHFPSPAVQYAQCCCNAYAQQGGLCRTPSCVGWLEPKSLEDIRRVLSRLPSAVTTIWHYTNVYIILLLLTSRTTKHAVAVWITYIRQPSDDIAYVVHCLGRWTGSLTFLIIRYLKAKRWVDLPITIVKQISNSLTARVNRYKNNIS